MLKGGGRAGGWREDVREEVWRVGTTWDRLRLHATADDSPHPGRSEPDLLCIFHVVFAAIGGSVLFCYFTMS